MTSRKELIATVAGFLALGFAVLALLYWTFLATPPLSFQSFDWTMRILVIAAIISFSVYIIAAPETLPKAAARRSTRLTANATLAVVVAVGIAILINFIAERVPSVRADWTAGQTFTLSQQTVTILENLPNNVTAVAFYSPQATAGVDRQKLEDLLKEYSSHGTRLQYEFVDPYLAPARATQYGVTRLGSVVFDNGQKREIANGVSEAEFTGALLRLQQTATKSVAFLTGHGERDTNSFDQEGLSQVKSALEKDNYVALVQDLTRSPEITATVLVIVEPTRALAAAEIQKIQQYLDGGGHLLLMLDPLMTDEAFQPFVGMLAKYGVTPVQGGVIDFQQSYSQQEPTLVGINSYPDHAITRDISRDRLVTLFPLSMGLKPPTSTVNGLTGTSFIQSSYGQQISWLETDIRPNMQGQIQLNYDEGKDIAGPVTMGIAIGPAEATETQTQTNAVKTRLVVYGDADFASNLGVSQPGVSNLDLFANSVSWLAGANELLSIRPKPEDAPRTIRLDTTQQNLLFVTTVIGLPALVIITGTLMWWRRR